MDRNLVFMIATAMTTASMTAAIALTASRTGTAADRRRLLAVLLQIAVMGWAALLALLGPVG